MNDKNCVPTLDTQEAVTGSIFNAIHSSLPERTLEQACGRAKEFGATDEMVEVAIKELNNPQKFQELFEVYGPTHLQQGALHPGKPWY